MFQEYMYVCACACAYVNACVCVCVMCVYDVCVCEMHARVMCARCVRVWVCGHAPVHLCFECLHSERFLLENIRSFAFSIAPFSVVSLARKNVFSQDPPL